MFSCLKSTVLFVGVLFGLYISESNAAHHNDWEDVEILGEFFLGAPVIAESIEWDPVNEVYYFFNSFYAELCQVEGRNLEAVINNEANITCPFNVTGYFNDSVFPTAMYTDGVTLYINDFSGEITLVNIEEERAYDSWFIYNGMDLAQLNGMCYNDIDGYLYVTDTGINITTFGSTNTGMIYRINTTNGNYEAIYNRSSEYGYIYPNGCTFNDDGVLYAIENSGSPRLIIYDTVNDIWEFVNAPASGDGIVFSNDGDLFITVFDVSENVNAPDGMYMISNSSIENNEYNFTLVLTNLSGPADMDYNEIDSVLVFPSLDLFFGIGYMYIVGIDEHEDTTTTATVIDTTSEMATTTVSGNDTTGGVTTAIETTAGNYTTDSNDTSSESAESKDGVYSIVKNAINLVNGGLIIMLVFKQL